MGSYNLEPNESIIIQSTSVLCEESGFMPGYTDELILTNMNIIHVSKGMFGNKKGVQKYPLNQVKILNDEAQAVMVKNSNDTPKLQIYLINSKVTFKFQNSGKKEIAKYINEINKVLVGKESSQKSVANQSAIPGAEYLAETLKDTVGVFKNAFGIKSKGIINAKPEKITKKCIGCMSPLTGTKDQSICCKYCDTDQLL